MPIKITENSIHIWKSKFEPFIYTGKQEISEDEKKEAFKYYFHKDTNSFLNRRINLRKILSFYLNCKPGEVKLITNQYGKPLLAGVEDSLHFSTSNSENLTLFAVSKARRIGIDVEKIRNIQGLNKIAQRYFSKDEIKQINSVQENRKTETFYRLWTKKEAKLKALGTGWTYSDEVSDRLNTPDNNFLFTFTPCPNYVGSVFTEGTPLDLYCFDFSLKIHLKHMERTLG